MTTTKANDFLALMTHAPAESKSGDEYMGDFGPVAPADVPDSPRGSIGSICPNSRAEIPATGVPYALLDM